MIAKHSLSIKFPVEKFKSNHCCRRLKTAFLLCTQLQVIAATNKSLTNKQPDQHTDTMLQQCFTILTDVIKH
jgi:hypothetical protein